MATITPAEKTLVRVYLARHGRNQTWLAKRVGVHKSALSRILDGTYVPSVAVAQKIEAITGVKLTNKADVEAGVGA